MTKIKMDYQKYNLICSLLWLNKFIHSLSCKATFNKPLKIHVELFCFLNASRLSPWSLQKTNAIQVLIEMQIPQTLMQCTQLVALQRQYDRWSIKLKNNECSIMWCVQFVQKILVFQPRLNHIFFNNVLHKIPLLNFKQNLLEIFFRHYSFNEDFSAKLRSQEWCARN